MKKQIIFLSALLLFPFVCFAQHGYNSASVGMGKVSAQSKRFPAPDEIKITEYLNYHTHRLPLPEGDEKVHLDLQISSADMFAPDYQSNRHHVLQIGFSTPLSADRHASAKPSNLCLLVDRSGSMQGGRLELVKEALKAFVNGLSYRDVVSLVVFDQVAEVMVPAGEIGNKQELLWAIENLSTRGSTNMSAGVDLACQQLMQHFSANQTNRVIILTDAQVNTGEVSPQAILARHASPGDYKLQEHVDFSLIGVGIHFNHDFARKFTANPHNSIHFIHDDEDVQKVFVKDAASLKTVAARQIELRLFFEGQESCFNTRKLYGLDNSHARYSWQLQDMNYGLTQVAMIGFQLGDDCWEGKAHLGIMAELSYYDPESGERVRQLKKIRIEPERAAYNYEVEKNWAIANLAQGLKSMSQSVQENPEQKHKEATKIIDYVISEVEARPGFLEDEDIQFMMKIVRAYQDDLSIAFKG